MKNENDIIIHRFIGSYCKGSIQVSLSYFWIYKHFNSYEYVVHHQSDVYLNINNCLENIKMNIPDLSGYILYKRRRYKNKYSLHYIPSSFYNKTFLPLFTQGPLFVMKRNVIELL